MLPITSPFKLKLGAPLIIQCLISFDLFFNSGKTILNDDIYDIIKDYIRKKYPKDPRVKRVKERFNPDKISESSPTSHYTSYSVNKGEKIVFCLRSKEADKELHDFNTITFVALHELAHLMTESIGHTPEFWDNFRFILKNAIQKGYYQVQDFKKKPIRYCGTDITDSPLKDADLVE